LSLRSCRAHEKVTKKLLDERFKTLSSESQ